MENRPRRGCVCEGKINRFFNNIPSVCLSLGICRFSTSANTVHRSETNGFVMFSDSVTKRRKNPVSHAAYQVMLRSEVKIMDHN